MTAEYADFLATKTIAAPLSGTHAADMHASLYDFQQAITRWAVRLGRAAIFADCGLGKTRMQLEWVRQVTKGPALIVTPLAVTEQTLAEAGAMSMDMTNIMVINYERLHKVDPGDYEAVVLDESSILKSIDGKTKQRLLSEWAVIPYRLCCTATPAPNDIAELANHAEFLGIMTRPEMLASFFVHDDGGWRLKGHAQDAFWRWMAAWSVYIRKPSDLGFADAGFELPPLRILDRVVEVPDVPTEGLFGDPIGGVQGRIAARRVSLAERVGAAAELIRSHDEQVLVWCGLNAEQDALARELGSACVSIQGTDAQSDKILREQQWRRGAVRVLITKPAIFGFGLNWQHCHRMIFLGLGDSYEQYYQAIRRCWRFGQAHPVEAMVVVSDAESVIVANVRRKERDADETARRVVAHMRELEQSAVRGTLGGQQEYCEDVAEGKDWRLMLGDSVERLGEVASESVGLSVFSPPFASLYTYSASDRDLGNSRTYDEFFEHFGYIITELLRVTMPGRRACVHVQQVSTTKATHGVIGWRDFRADTVRAFVAMGWVYDGEVVIDKDPQAQAIRTKSKALMFVQKNKDSAWSRPAMADYILLLRKPGDNLEPVKTDVTNEEWILWARPIWYGIRETNTLNAAAARADRDEKHIAPLQLETIERCVRLWSNRGDLVCSPFAGIGSEGYVALRHGRRFVGCELKPEYWRKAAENLSGARAQLDLFADEEPA